MKSYHIKHTHTRQRETERGRERTWEAFMVYTADTLVKGKIIPVLLSIAQEWACQLTEKNKEHNCFTTKTG